MQFAIAIPTDADSWRVVRRAEELGFARAWFYDTHRPVCCYGRRGDQDNQDPARHRRVDPVEPDCAGHGKCLRLIK